MESADAQDFVMAAELSPYSGYLRRPYGVGIVDAGGAWDRCYITSHLYALVISKLLKWPNFHQLATTPQQCKLPQALMNRFGVFSPLNGASKMISDENKKKYFRL